MEISNAIRPFNYRRLTRCIYGGAHDAVIGEWINWWIALPKNTRSIVHSVINPAIQARYRGKRYCADLLLAEHSGKSDIGPDRSIEQL